MTLTEGQQAALKRVVAYMDEMYSVASPYHGCTEDANLLRAMIDSSGTVEPTGGFDLERARGLRDFLQDDCAEVGDIWGEMIAEIERLRKIIDSPPEEESWKADYDLLHQLDASGTVCVARKWHAAYRKAQNSNLLRKQENERLLDALVQCKHTVEQQAAQIKELEDALVNERAWRICHIPQDRVGHWPRYEPMLQDEARQQLQAEGKIGPDAEPANIQALQRTMKRQHEPRSWQITEERKAALKRLYGLLVIRYKYSYPDETETLRAMLEEAGQ